ncbi:uncharacterized protein BO97DRAFT_415767 [Aspergillus homomorphus CBS 101889]|uniref:DUF6606 domain-containing protein n=1 Tax=Aspergillus homomorphus (strain CBS 101889) TaxID=1450537 RepID=A0A395HT47_ASPHC|nr:hypothetical protein BO97DRAFT_415767 [Aspergillus homomorphus CBS 101889]RAL10726.1 hypothetical protein BO97DRAFT_415767 [Aspergillus homomorphus CBS 101889]
MSLSVPPCFLPPRLPQAEDYQPELDIFLLENVMKALRGFKQSAPTSQAGTLTIALEMTSRFRQTLGSFGELDEDELHDEDRDTTHPKIITELFMAFLRPMYTNMQATQVMKNTREEVMWLNTRRPWRRSSLWLMIRIVLQLAFRRLGIYQETDDSDKQFIVYFLGSVLRSSHDLLPSKCPHIMSTKIVRRLLNLSFSNKACWYTPVQRALEKAKDTIQYRWRKIMAHENHYTDFSKLTSLGFILISTALYPVSMLTWKKIQNRKRLDREPRGDHTHLQHLSYLQSRNYRVI